MYGCWSETTTKHGIMHSEIEVAAKSGTPKLRTGRPPTWVTDARYKRILNNLLPHLHEWQHAGGLAKKLNLEHGVVATILRRAANEGKLETVRTNPTSYRVAGSAAKVLQPDVNDVDDLDDISIDSLRWLKVHLLVPSTVDALRNGTRTKLDHVVEHLRAGIAAGYVVVEDAPEKIYSLNGEIPDNLSRGQLQIDALRRRMRRHFKGPMFSNDLVISMGLTRERVRQLLERAEERGIVERIPGYGRPYRFKLTEASEPGFTPESPSAESGHPVYAEPISHLPITTRALNVLADNGVATVGDLVGLTRDQITRLPGMGRKSVDEIVIALANLGLEPGTSEV